MQGFHIPSGRAGLPSAYERSFSPSTYQMCHFTAEASPHRALKI